MKYFLMILIASVFLGTEIIAIPTPFAQLTIYRIFALSVPLLIVYFLIQKNKHIKIKENSYATFFVAIFIFWWLWSIISFIWVEDIRLWLQAVFLLTLGVSSVIAVYLWTKNRQEWETLIKISWVMMSLLVVLGYYEIITNHYFFADMTKLDKYSTFVADPMTRIPITHFENQNDFATMLLAYVATSLILYYITSHSLKRIGYLISTFLGSYLIYRSSSRMILLCLFLYIFSLILLTFKWDFKRKHYIIGLLIVIIVSAFSILYIPAVQNMIDVFIYTGRTDIVTGDTGRVNLLRNGIIFLASTFGFGVGAGNIESWMANYRFLPTQKIINMHHWWGEILVGYGLLVFILYVLAYGLMIYRLFQIRRNQTKRRKKVTNQLIAFMVVYILASITSANNMLIEWHWVFFGLIISYIKIFEDKQNSLFELENETRRNYEFNYDIK